MANINDMIYIIQFLVLVGIFLYQMFNLMHKGKLYDIRISFILIICLTIAWGMGLLIVLLETSKATYSMLFRIESMLFVLSWLFFFFEVLFSGIASVTKPVKAFNALKAQKTLNKGQNA